jgi:hypothetical protein
VPAVGRGEGNEITTEELKSLNLVVKGLYLFSHNSMASVTADAEEYIIIIIPLTITNILCILKEPQATVCT